MTLEALKTEMESEVLPAKKTSTAVIPSSATHTAPTARAKNPTSTEPLSPGLHGPYGAHAALILTTSLVALPSPLASLWGGGADGSAAPVLVASSLWTALTTALWFQTRRIQKARSPEKSLERLSAALLLTDVLGLTSLLSLSGAAQNPFTMLYFVPITQATFVARAWTFPVAAAAVTGFGFLLNQTAATLRPHLNHPHHAHFFDHVQGMAIALAVSGVFVTVFVRRIAQELNLRNQAIERLSQKRSEERIAIALGALAAGAGHELGSPLGSIQLLVEELPHLRSDEQTGAISTIVGEVQRMKKIVHSMSASQLSADVVQSDPWPLSLLAADLSNLGVHLKTLNDASTTQPRSVLAQILRELIRNAYSAKSDAHVTVEFELKNAALCIAVADDGPGMSAEDLAHACEPFVSHAKSTGLGLFLAKVHVEQLGGQLELTSEPGQGTRAALHLPIHPPLSPLRLR